MPQSLRTNWYNNVEEEKLSSQQKRQKNKGFSECGAVFCISISIHPLPLLPNQAREFAIQQQDVKEPNAFAALWSWVICNKAEDKGG